MGVLDWGIALALSLAGQAGLIEAGRGRSGLALLEDSLGRRRILRAAAAVLLAAALGWLAVRIGWETGLPLWLGIQMAAGLSMLYLGAWNRRLRRKVAAAAAILAAALAALA